MNTPAPVSTPPPTNPAAPTIGSILGTVLGGVLINKTSLGSDPVLGTTAMTAVTAAFTALFHWLGTKLGAPL